MHEHNKTHANTRAHSGSPLGARRAILFNGILCCLSIFAVLIAGEAFVRLAMPRDDIAEWYLPHPRYHHLLKPNFHQRYVYRPFGAYMDVQTNASGFRDTPRERAPDDAALVLFLGDSFVFGYGLDVEQRMDTALRRMAREREISLDTINWGVPGWGTSHQALYAADHLKTVQPDALVLLFCNNDPANDRGVGLPTLPDMDSSLYPLKTLLRRRLHLYRMLLEVRAFLRAGRQENRESSGDVRPDGSPCDIMPEDWRRTKGFIFDIHQALNAANPGTQMLLMAASPDDAPVRESLTAIASEKPGLHYLDIAPGIAHLSQDERQMPWDAHWSPAVHHAAAAAVLDWIAANLAADRHKHTVEPRDGLVSVSAKFHRLWWSLKAS